MISVQGALASGSYPGCSGVGSGGDSGSGTTDIHFSNALSIFDSEIGRMSIYRTLHHLSVFH